jgi:hypothetical protein
MRVHSGARRIYRETKMKKPALHWLGRSLAAVMVAALLTGCADEAPVGLNQKVVAIAAAEAVVPDLGICADLKPPAGSTVVYHVYARGVQIYRWNGTSWAPVGPSAQLFADPNERGLVGIHYGGPTWETLSGSKVVGEVAERCTYDPSAVQWLLLTAKSAEGPGVFRQVKYIQRLNTVGGIAPSSPGTVGQEVQIPYSTEYFFYRAR